MQRAHAAAAWPWQFPFCSWRVEGWRRQSTLAMASVVTQAWLYILKQQEMEDSIMMQIERKRRKKVDNMYLRRNDEGYHSNLISKHLLDDEIKFHNFFRLTRYQFQFVLSAIKSDIEKLPSRRVRRVISPEEKLAVTLRYLATGEAFHSLKYAFRISHSYISVIVKEVVSAICTRLLTVLIPPPTGSIWKSKATEFWERWQFPNCVGAIDGKHIRIVCPSKSGSLFFNYKNFFSIVLLAIVDANYKFVAVDVGSYGKEGDSGIFAKSNMGKKLYSSNFDFPPEANLPGSERVLPHVIVGDEAFRLHKNIMKPFNRSQTKDNFEKAIFNYRLCRARRVSENAFGLLCQVFRLFYSPIGVKPETCDKLVLAACCLHNLIREDCQSLPTENSETTVRNMTPLSRNGGFAQAEGFQVRDSFKEFFVAEGKVEWQERAIQGT